MRDALWGEWSRPGFSHTLLLANAGNADIQQLVLRSAGLADCGGAGKAPPAVVSLAVYCYSSALAVEYAGGPIIAFSRGAHLLVPAFLRAAGELFCEPVTRGPPEMLLREGSIRPSDGRHALAGGTDLATRMRVIRREWDNGVLVVQLPQKRSLDLTRSLFVLERAMEIVAAGAGGMRTTLHRFLFFPASHSGDLLFSPPSSPLLLTPRAPGSPPAQHQASPRRSSTSFPAATLSLIWASRPRPTTPTR